jgi:hypothetical protein
MSCWIYDHGVVTDNITTNYSISEINLIKLTDNVITLKTVNYKTGNNQGTRKLSRDPETTLWTRQS